MKQDGWGRRRHWLPRDFCRLLGLGCPKQAFAKIAALSIAGLSPQDVIIVPLPIDQHRQAFMQLRVDAVVTFEPVRSELLSGGARLIFDSSKIPGEVIDVLIAHADIANTRRKEIDVLLHEWYEAVVYYDQNPADAADRMAKRYRISGSAFQTLTKSIKTLGEDDQLQLLVGESSTLQTAARRLNDFMFSKNLLPRSVNTDNIFKKD